MTTFLDGPYFVSVSGFVLLRSVLGSMTWTYMVVLSVSPSVLRSWDSSYWTTTWRFFVLSFGRTYPWYN